jgi:hypothetical protein
MSTKSHALSLMALLLALGWGGTAQAQYLLTGNSGGKLQLGTGLPLPVAPSGTFLGGLTSINGGTSCGQGPGGCPVGTDGPGTAYWPTLPVPPNPDVASGGLATRTIMQNLATAKGGTITVPPSVLTKPAAGAPVPIGVFSSNNAVFQVATSISYAWPAATAVLAPGGGPGIVNGIVVLTEPVSGGSITYSGSTKAFGGSGQFSILPGSGAGTGRIPPNTMGVPPVLSGWINFAGGTPATAMVAAIVGGTFPAGLGAQGQPVASAGFTTMFGALTPGNGPFGAFNIGTPCSVFCVGTNGTINGSAPLPTVMLGTMTLSGFSNMVTISKGYPWTTGLITIAQPGAGETFWLSGADMRVSGVGNLSLVSGALSNRALSGQNANRGWVRLALPEPPAALGAAGALALLAFCHGLIRGRRR